MFLVKFWLWEIELICFWFSFDNGYLYRIWFNIVLNHLWFIFRFGLLCWLWIVLWVFLGCFSNKTVQNCVNSPKFTKIKISKIQNIDWFQKRGRYGLSGFSQIRKYYLGFDDIRMIDWWDITKHLGNAWFVYDWNSRWGVLSNFKFISNWK